MTNLAPALVPYLVAYVDDQDRTRTARVVLEPGVTTVDDIPRILAVSGRKVARILTSVQTD
ncbi:hypothetical protein [Nocardia asteroides]|uniref:hypothetical protein n=1 Tax=Nocardia asteroides TaxID=1824 RepID=UPI003408CEBF